MRDWDLEKARWIPLDPLSAEEYGGYVPWGIKPTDGDISGDAGSFGVTFGVKGG